MAVLSPARGEAKYTLFVRPSDKLREIWDGRRAGVEGAKTEYGADAAYPESALDQEMKKIFQDATTLYYTPGQDAALDGRVVGDRAGDDRRRAGAWPGFSFRIAFAVP